MAISGEELEQMLLEIVLKKPPTLTTPEANEMRERLQKECDEIIASGGTVEIPHT